MIPLIFIVLLGPPTDLTPEQIDPFIVEGGLSWYGKKWEGRPLSCGGIYEESRGPWLALDVGWYESGRVSCGDWFLIFFEDGSTMLAKARDAGHHANYSTWDTGLPHIADMPYYWREGRITATGHLVNLTKVERVTEVLMQIR
jgi:hypothetical protein